MVEAEIRSLLDDIYLDSHDSIYLDSHDEISGDTECRKHFFAIYHSLDELEREAKSRTVTTNRRT